VVRLEPDFFQAMRDFVVAAVERGEVRSVPVEVYWSFAFAPLYQLIKFHRHGFGKPRPGCANQKPEPFVLTDEIVSTAVEMVVRGLRP